MYADEPLPEVDDRELQEMQELVETVNQWWSVINADKEYIEHNEPGRPDE